MAGYSMRDQKTYQRAWWIKNHERINAKRRLARKLNPEQTRKNAVKYNKLQNQRIKQEAFNNLGNVCACCNLNDTRFLSVDHVKNDGWKDRSASGSRKLGAYLAKKSGWDKTRFQILCFNCNFAKSINGGVCPHQQSQLSVVPALKPL